jgi:putative glutamine amidotransferase
VELAIGPTLAHTASRFFVDAVVRAGGIPFVLPVIDAADVEAMLDVVDGVVMTGGGDLAPARYRAEPVPETESVDPARDAFDIRLVVVALERKLPLLAVCRGMQVLNVALGGSLIQHVPAATGHEHSRPDHWRDGSHRVRLDPHSHLAGAVGEVDLQVNSLHHQAVGEAAPGLRPVAWAEDGTVEGVELAGGPYLVAVQWHPEMMEERPEQQGLFHQLVEHAAEGAERRLA